MAKRKSVLEKTIEGAETKAPSPIVKRFGNGPYKLNLGCGNDVRDGYVNIDKFTGTNILKLDLEKDKLPFPDGSVEKIVAHHVLEHIWNLLPLMNECQRVLKHNGTFHIRVPVYPTVQAFQDPTHVRFFTPQTIEYFIRDNDYWKSVGSNYDIEPFAWGKTGIENGFELVATLRK